MDLDEHEQFFAAYRAWEAASEACYAKVLQGVKGEPLDRDMAALQRLHAEWLEKSQPFAESRSAKA